MPVTGVPTITAPGIPTDASRPFPVRDPLLRADTVGGVAQPAPANSGVRFLFDLAFPYSYPSGSKANPSARPAPGNPAAGAVVGDVTDTGDGTAAVGTAGGILYAGGGFDFTNSAAPTGSMDQGVVGPASVLADLAAAFGGKVQRYLFVMYAKLPTLANWNTSGSILSMLGDKAFNAQPSLLVVAQGNGGQLQVRRQTTAAANEQMTLNPTAAEAGNVVQIGVWRNDAGQGFRLKALAAGSAALATSRALGTDNDQAFGANALCFGRNAASFAGASGTAVNASLSGVRVYRGFIENLARSGRDPTVVLDADYARVQARIAASAALNGGTSQIFV